MKTSKAQELKESKSEVFCRFLFPLLYTRTHAHTHARIPQVLTKQKDEATRARPCEDINYKQRMCHHLVLRIITRRERNGRNFASSCSFKNKIKTIFIHTIRHLEREREPLLLGFVTQRISKMLEGLFGLFLFFSSPFCAP